MKGPATTREQRIRRHRRVRAMIKGTLERPRLCVFRSNRFIWAQLIDDVNGHTIVEASDRQTSPTKDKKQTKKETRVQRAEKVGMMIAKRAAEKNISVAVFDRAGYRYHGRVKAVAEGARKGGLNL